MRLLPEPGSFRDPLSRVFLGGGDQVYRVLSAQGARDWCEFEATGLKEQFEREHFLIPSQRLDGRPEGIPDECENSVFLKHPKIPFVTYPYEWPFSMLKEAAALHLRLNTRLINRDFILKDSSPCNVQFVGTMPIFIDVGSICKYQRGSPWASFGQFCATMLNPLLISSFLHIPFTELLRGHLDGINARLAARMFGGRYTWHPTIIKYIYLQRFMEQTFQRWNMPIPQAAQGRVPKKIVESLFVSIGRALEKLELTLEDKHWVEYAARNTYSCGEADHKRRFVEEAFERTEKKHILWDIGCNTGTFSILGKTHFKYVVAMDSDFEAVEVLFNQLRREREKAILPIVMDFVNPSPSCGWNGEERKSLFARGRPDCILMLGLLHHLRVSRGIPLWKIVEGTACHSSNVVVEFVSRDDDMFRFLAKNSGQEFDDYTEENTEKWFGEHFRVLKKEKLSKTRTLFFFARRDGGGSG